MLVQIPDLLNVGFHAQTEFQFPKARNRFKLVATDCPVFIYDMYETAQIF